MGDSHQADAASSSPIGEARSSLLVANEGEVIVGDSDNDNSSTRRIVEDMPTHLPHVLPQPTKDGSVISGVTDPASLDPVEPLLQNNLQGSNDDDEEGVPDQVILPPGDSVTADSSSPLHNAAPIPPPPPPPPQQQAAVTAVNPPLIHTVDSSEKLGAAANTIGVGLNNNDYHNTIANNEIAERSPGGRYVRFMEKLGSGASKDVFRAYDTEEGIEVAWNVVTLSGVPKNERNRIVNEVRLLERLHHHNIISFHGSWVNRERQEVNFVTEILSSGTLKSFINKVQVIRWKIAKRWAVQILKGLEYLHAQDPPVIHRDLKCENIFINGTSGDLRIGDLGLSTVHKNGKVLSVLGTPEFMAPDMYEETSYDVKVDIYAFGMCLLEIFTKEIPYSECNNPAQIYKKVSNSEPPDVLNRLQSKHAREFIKLCLGYKDEAGKFVRPTASELLLHPFLVKRSNDDDEVVVHPRMREAPIVENGESPAIVAATSTAEESVDNMEAPPTRPQQSSSPDEEDGDRFNEMPESETNMRKVTVLMGRDTALTEDETTKETNSGVPTYLVAAAVIQNENLSVRPYADDKLKLVVTLPVDGQTHNVQFDFHLVEDDPVQVAKEMVVELQIPQEAVLEISATISGLACAARMKQDKYAVRMQQEANSGASTPHPTPVQESHKTAVLEPSSSGSVDGGSSHMRVNGKSTNHEQQPRPQGLPQQVPPSTEAQSAPLPSHIPRPDAAPPSVPESGGPTLHTDQPTLDKASSTQQEGNESDEEDEDFDQQLRQLDEEYKKNMQRAKKVYHNRMDNLQRSQVEREAQHRKTLEKHEKERVEFEKRLAQEEEQQAKRIDQMKKEWDRQRSTLSLTKKRAPRPGSISGATLDSLGMESVNEGSSATVRPMGVAPLHTRSTSVSSSTQSFSPATSDHKVPKGGDPKSPDR